MPRKARTEEITEEAAVTAQEPQKVAPVAARKSFAPDDIVTVRNGFQGMLVYRSSKTGERFVWDEFGSEQDMEFSELKNARSASKKYFINNWWMFDDPDVVEQLGMTQYYKAALRLDDFDKLFEKTPEQIEKVVSKLSIGQKKSLAYRAKQLVAENKIDSNRAIQALERSLGVELVER